MKLEKEVGIYYTLVEPDKRQYNSTMKSNSSKQSAAMKTTLIAPCGMNCRLCSAYARDKNACPGCLGDDRLKMKSTNSCKIKNCTIIKKGKTRFCFTCKEYPCGRLRHLDKRYRTKYGMSMIENLESIKRSGVREFVRQEKTRWACPDCGELLCVHKESCANCGHTWR